MRVPAKPALHATGRAVSEDPLPPAFDVLTSELRDDVLADTVTPMNHKVQL